MRLKKKCVILVLTGVITNVWLYLVTTNPDNQKLAEHEQVAKIYREAKN